MKVYDYNPFEVAQKLKMSKGSSLPKGRKRVPVPKFVKSYKQRRAAIKRGESGVKATFGNEGHSSHYW